MNRFDWMRFVELREQVRHPQQVAGFRLTCPEAGRVYDVVRQVPVVQPGLQEPFRPVVCVACYVPLEPLVQVLRGLCCPLHNRHCEPGELCCAVCPEALHPQHPVGVRCVVDEDTEV